MINRVAASEVNSAMPESPPVGRFRIGCPLASKLLMRQTACAPAAPPAMIDGGTWREPPMFGMSRRDFVALLGGAAWPVAALAQQRALPLIGILNSGTEQLRPDQFDGLHRGLKETGFVAGTNVTVISRGAGDNYDRLPVLAAEFVRLPVAVIATAGGPVAALAAKAATSTIPIVFAAVSDPVKSGLVASSQSAWWQHHRQRWLFDRARRKAP